MPGRLCGAALALALGCAPALSQSIESAYTSFDAKKCKHEKGTDVEDYGSWRCPGYQGMRVLLSAGDQRMFVTYGPSRKTDLAA